MNRYAYLNELSNCIQNELPADEYNNVMQYYTEYFVDAGADKEQEVISELGAPDELARRIIAEFRGKQPSDVTFKRKKGLPVGWIIFIAIVGSPVWLGLLCAAIGVGAAVAAVVVSIAAVAAAMILRGGTAIAGGNMAAFSTGANGVLAVGTGCLCICVGLLLTMLFVLIVNAVVKGCKAASAKRKKKKYGGYTHTGNAM